eukprot:gene28612-37587_t
MRRSSKSNIEYQPLPVAKKRSRREAGTTKQQRTQKKNTSSPNTENTETDRQLLENVTILPATNGLCKCKVCGAKISKATCKVGVKSFFKLRGCTFPSMSWVHPACALRFASAASLRGNTGSNKKSTTRKCKHCEAILCEFDESMREALEPAATTAETLCILVQLKRSCQYFCGKCFYESAVPECRDSGTEANDGQDDSTENRVRLGIPCEDIADFSTLSPALQSVARRMFY